MELELASRKARPLRKRVRENVPGLETDSKTHASNNIETRNQTSSTIDNHFGKMNRRMNWSTSNGAENRPDWYA